MQHERIVHELLDYIYTTNPVAEERKPLPLDESLYELGVLDSFGVVELVSFIETHWSIQILDSEITKEKFGGVNKMAALIEEKLSVPAARQPV
jgi:acyl carrier protein